MGRRLTHSVNPPTIIIVLHQQLQVTWNNIQQDYNHHFHDRMNANEFVKDHERRTLY